MALRGCHVLHSCYFLVLGKRGYFRYMNIRQLAPTGLLRVVMSAGLLDDWPFACHRYGDVTNRQLATIRRLALGLSSSWWQKINQGLIVMVIGFSDDWWTGCHRYDIRNIRLLMTVLSSLSQECWLIGIWLVVVMMEGMRRLTINLSSWWQQPPMRK